MADILSDASRWPHKNETIKDEFDKQECGTTGGSHIAEHGKTPLTWRQTDPSRAHRVPHQISGLWAQIGGTSNEATLAAAAEGANRRARSHAPTPNRNQTANAAASSSNATAAQIADMNLLRTPARP